MYMDVVMFIACAYYSEDRRLSVMVDFWNFGQIESLYPIGYRVKVLMLSSFGAAIYKSESPFCPLIFR